MNNYMLKKFYSSNPILGGRKDTEQLNPEQQELLERIKTKEEQLLKNISSMNNTRKSSIYIQNIF